LHDTLTKCHDTGTKRLAGGVVLDEWVVTYRIENRQCAGHWGLAEFFRGSEEECKRIRSAFAGGESDCVPTTGWEVVIGPAADWEDFLSSADATDLNGR
jgi:hypothetical protein